MIRVLEIDCDPESLHISSVVARLVLAFDDEIELRSLPLFPHDGQRVPCTTKT